MYLTFLGACREVTGSKYLLEVNGKNYLIDCGMEQGPDIYENQDLPLKAESIDAVFLTHAHIDHSGMLPALVKEGFRGRIYLTRASRDLARIMLLDSAGIQESEAEWRRRKAKRGDRRLDYEPIYTTEDVNQTVRLFEPCGYDVPVKISEDLSVVFKDAGHILGSASIRFTAKENGIEKMIVFSGDIGNENKPIIRSPDYFTSADYAVMESTYGDRVNEKPVDYTRELSDIIVRTFRRGGNVVIPSFAVGRMQELLYALREIKQKRLLGEFNNCPVYVDSPLAVEATKIFTLNDSECFDDEAKKLVESGVNPLSFPGLFFSVSTEQSKAINADNSPKVILAASGMCEAGRIRHHLKHNLWRPECSVVFVGYQVNGTLGRIILEGAEQVTLFNEKVDVRAEICRLQGTSSHADMNALIAWAEKFNVRPEKIFVTHGEDSVAEGFARKLVEKCGIDAVAPYNGAVWDLLLNESVAEGNRERRRDKKDRKRTESAPFSELLGSMEKLQTVVDKSRVGTNADMRNLTEEIERLVKKYNR